MPNTTRPIPSATKIVVYPPLIMTLSWLTDKFHSPQEGLKD